MPWDAGGVPARLHDYVGGLLRQRILVPGCGSGYEVKLFAERGHDVVGIDFSEAAVEASRRVLGKLGSHVRKADFFALAEEPFDLVYERTFLCALPRSRWPQWGSKIATLVRPGGRLAGFFYFDDNERGPPFGISMDALRALLEPAFVMQQDEPVPAEHSVAVLAGRERWQVWERRL